MIGGLEGVVESIPGTTPILVARVLGRFELSFDGRRLGHRELGRTIAERLVKLLLVTPGHAVRREVAAELLWPEADPDASRGDLRRAIHFARRALDTVGVITTDGGAIALDPARLDLDLDRLWAAFAHVAKIDRRPVRRRGGGGPDPDAEVTEAAVACIIELGALELLPDDPYEDWLIAPREELRDQWQRVAIRAAERARSTGRRADAQTIVARLLERDPTDEAAHRLAMVLYADEGRHHAVRRQFELCRNALRDGLDAAPSAETLAAFRRAARKVERHAHPAASPARLVGRDAELARLEELLDGVAAGRSSAVVLHGPAGIGKSRLLDELAATARASGWHVVRWQGVRSTLGLAFAPLRTGLLAGLTPEAIAGLGEPGRSGLSTLGSGSELPGRLVFADRPALVEALADGLRQLARRRPTLLSLDDLPFIDGWTLEVLEVALGASSSARVLIAASRRDEEPPSDAADRFEDVVRRCGGLELRLGPLARADVEALVTGHLGGEALADDLGRHLHEISGGNPLFCIELARAGRDQGAVGFDGRRWTWSGKALTDPLPESLRRLVADRSATLSTPARDLLGTAAAFGSEVSFETLSAVLPDLRGGLIEALEEALRCGLLVERGDRYAFSHPLYRLALEGDTMPARRGERHLRIALALAGRGTASANPAELESRAADHPHPIPVAEHALAAVSLGRPEARPLAVAFGFAAGRLAGSLFDLPSAADLLRRSLDAWKRLPADVAASLDASGAYASLAELRMGAGDDDVAAGAFRAAIAAARTPETLADAYVRALWLPYRHGEFEATIALAEEGLGRLPAEAAVPRARLLAMIGWCLGRLHRFDEAIRALGEAVRVEREAGDRRSETYDLDMLGTMLGMVDRMDESVACLERSLAIALELGDPRAELVRAHLGATLTRSGHPAMARPHLERCLELTHQMGDHYRESIVVWMLAEMEDALGHSAAAVAMRRRELDLLGSMGGNPHNEALAHAHIAHLARRGGDERTAEDETELARVLAGRDPDPGYPARIEAALAVEHWSDLRTG